jgi:RNA polymerase sigma factor (sigma-70 family)
MTTTMTPSCEDAELVRDCLHSDRNAFERIVRKYQSVICALTYSACGDLAASEDLAQTTFVTAWRRLSFLDEPSKLKSWLCSIARHVCADFLRARRKVRARFVDESAVNRVASDATSPDQRAITEEQRALLWRSVRRLPASLREPIVLFYRKDQSVRDVAEALELSEEAVRQRLSRGRLVLRESLRGWVENALRETGPDRNFTAGVMAALPFTTLAAKAALGAKGANIVAAGGVSNAAVMFGAPAFLGALLGWRMRRDNASSPQGRKAVGRFWRATLISIAVAAIPPLLLTFPLVHQFPDQREKILWAMTRWMGVSYAGVLVGLLLWARGRRKTAFERDPKPRTIKYPLIAMSLAALILIALYGFLDNARVRVVSAAEALRLARSDPSASLYVQQLTNGTRDFVVGWPRQRRFVIAPMDAAIEELVKNSRTPIPVLVQGRDFEVLGWPGRMLPLLCVFVISAGAAIVIQRKTG